MVPLIEDNGSVVVPPTAVPFGLRAGEKGTHTSRTIMLDELQTLMSARPVEATRESYVDAIVGENVLAKRTAATRRLTNQRLSELYGLNPAIPLFRVFRQLWPIESSAKPVLAMLLALARDPLLRATAAPVLALSPGAEVGRQAVTDAVREAVKNRLNDATLDKVVRNSLSSWTQSGHLYGRARKFRQLVNPTPLVVAFALLLGHICGRRGERLFDSFWCSVLDRPVEELTFLAMDAKRLGLIDFKQAGNVIEVNFRELLTPEERKLIDEQS